MCINCSFSIYICCFVTTFEYAINTTLILHFSIFEDGSNPPSLIFTSFKFQLLVRFGGPLCVIMSNVMPSGQTVAEISRFLYFSRWRLPPSWIFKIPNFNGPNGEESRTASLCQILSKSLKLRSRYGDFYLFFHDGGRRHLGFVMRVLGPPTKGIWWSLSLSKIR